MKIFIVLSGESIPRIYHPDFHDLEIPNDHIYPFTYYRDQIHVTTDERYAKSLTRSLSKTRLPMNVLDSVNNTLAPVVRDCLIRQMNQLRKGGILERAAARRMEKDLSLLKAAMEEHEAVVSEIEAKILETGGNSESPMVYRTQQGAAVIIPTNCF